MGELAHDCGPAHFEVIFGAPEGSPNGNENGLPKGALRELSKPDFKRLFSEKFFNIASLLIVSRCIASRRANVR